jgi:hypothetical protein
MNLYEAGVVILYTIMTIDGVIDEEEPKEIARFLLNFGFDFGEGKKSDLPSLVMEIGMLGALDKQSLMKRWKKAVSVFAQNSSEKECEKMALYALDMICADRIILPEEEELFDNLGKAWNIDTDTLISNCKDEFNKGGLS